MQVPGPLLPEALIQGLRRDPSRGGVVGIGQTATPEQDAAPELGGHSSSAVAPAPLPAQLLLRDIGDIPSLVLGSFVKR